MPDIPSIAGCVCCSSLQHQPSCTANCLKCMTPPPLLPSSQAVLMFWDPRVHHDWTLPEWDHDPDDCVVYCTLLVGP